MTQRVGEAWEQFNRENREVVVRSFRCLGISPKFQSKGVLAEGLKNWELTPNPVDSSVEDTGDNPETDSSDHKDEPLSLFNTDRSSLNAGDSLSPSSVSVPSLPACSASAPAPTAYSAYSALTATARSRRPRRPWRAQTRKTYLLNQF